MDRYSSVTDSDSYDSEVYNVQLKPAIFPPKPAPKQKKYFKTVGWLISTAQSLVSGKNNDVPTPYFNDKSSAFRSFEIETKEFKQRDFGRITDEGSSNSLSQSQTLLQQDGDADSDADSDAFHTVRSASFADDCQELHSSWQWSKKTMPDFSDSAASHDSQYVFDGQCVTKIIDEDRSSSFEHADTDVATSVSSSKNQDKSSAMRRRHTERKVRDNLEAPPVRRVKSEKVRRHSHRVHTSASASESERSHYGPRCNSSEKPPRKTGDHSRRISQHETSRRHEKDHHRSSPSHADTPTETGHRHNPQEFVHSVGSKSSKRPPRLSRLQQHDDGDMDSAASATSLISLAEESGCYQEKAARRKKTKPPDIQEDQSYRKYDSLSKRHLQHERKRLKHPKAKWNSYKAYACSSRNSRMSGTNSRMSGYSSDCSSRPLSTALILKSDANPRPNGVLGILLDYLDNNITLISRMQDKGTLSNIIVNIWGKICSKLKDVVETKPELEEEHYNRVGDSLKFLKHHFQNNLGENGIAEDKLIKKREFTEVIDTMELQKMDTDELIILHYKEQSEERGERSTGAGVIDLKLSLKERRDGKAILFVKLLGARELIALDTNGKSDPFIQLQVVPHHVFPDCELKQSTVKKSTLDPMYNEMFEFIIPQDQICNGVLVLSVFDYDFISANDFEGEAMVRLTDLPKNSEQHVKWTMALHRPKKDSIYKILEGRINDKVAMKFVEIRKKAMEAEDFMLEPDSASNSGRHGLES